ncbi:unnamed protein product [Urochloa decumbens]|uniref:HMA domain-containing protein n=1 Tax=Urochloa decumbens TaxID=240449 RepID=A0ABC9CA38_9POAL
MDEENASSTKSITIELKVYMHCDACERKVRRTINKVEGEEVTERKKYFSLIIRLFVLVTTFWCPSLGVETVEIDREENKVTVTGDFEPEKVVKKIKKKTGKKAEILIPEEDEAEEEGVGQEPYVPYYYENPVLYPEDADVPDEFRSYKPETWNLHYFDDENAQACMVM